MTVYFHEEDLPAGVRLVPSENLQDGFPLLLTVAMHLIRAGKCEPGSGRIGVQCHRPGETFNGMLRPGVSKQLQLPKLLVVIGIAWLKLDGRLEVTPFRQAISAIAANRKEEVKADHYQAATGK